MSNGDCGEAFQAMCESPDYELMDLDEHHEDDREDYEPSPYNGDDPDGGAHEETDDPGDEEGGDREDDFDDAPAGLEDDRDTDDDRDPFDAFE